MLRMVAVLLFVLPASLGLALPRPPEGARAQREGRVTYYFGTVYIASVADTARLQSLGFRRLVFDSRVFGSLKYRAEWPDTIVALPMPDYLNGMDYEAVAQEIPDTYDASQDSSPGGFARGSVHVVSPARMPPGSMWFDTAASHRYLEQLDVRVRTTRGPAPQRPERVIEGRRYVHGLVTMTAAADTADLTPFGFFRFELDSPPDKAADDPPDADYRSYRAWWPADLRVSSLPEGIIRVQQDRVRLGESPVQSPAR